MGPETAARRDSRYRGVDIASAARDAEGAGVDASYPLPVEGGGSSFVIDLHVPADSDAERREIVCGRLRPVPAPA
jgi:hypothetical protein